MEKRPPIKYPEIKVQLTGIDGNAFVILGACQRAIRRSGLENWSEINKEFHQEATSGDYNHLLQTCMVYFDCN